MSKTALDVVLGTMDKRWMWDTLAFAENLVCDLRSAGWLRERPTEYQDTKGALDLCRMQMVEQRERIVELTRERDEAQKMRDYHEGRQRIAEESSATLGIELAAMRKERDEARANAAYAVGDWDKLQREVERLRATQSSPEVLAVVEALAAYKAARPECFDLLPGATRAWTAVVDALAAVERKAEPKPRYEVVVSSGGWPEGGCVRSVATQELVFGVWRTGTPQEHAARCRAECDKLNAADAAGRKS